MRFSHVLPTTKVILGKSGVNADQLSFPGCGKTKFYAQKQAFGMHARGYSR